MSCACPERSREPYASGERWELYRGDCLAVLPSLGPVDCVITDPPYSSGGMMRADRARRPSRKYLGRGGDYLPQFMGDNRDGRGYLRWSALWMSACLELARPGAVIAVCTDWRQLPTTTDALQAAGWVWRGLIPWCKPGARPQQGRFSQAAEFVVWGSAGPMAPGGPCHPGYYVGQAPHAREERAHTTQKPLPLMDMLVAVCPPGGRILDPFLGAGTTGIAALNAGYSVVGIERSEEYCEVAARKLAEAAGGLGEEQGRQLSLAAAG